MVETVKSFELKCDFVCLCVVKDETPLGSDADVMYIWV